MVDTKEPLPPVVSKNLQKTLGQIEKAAGNVSDVGELTCEAVSKILVQAPERWERETCQEIVDSLFKHAGAQLKDDHDKKVLEGLKKLIH